MSGKSKLLLADDSITIQKVINLTFAEEGLEVTTVGNGATAVELLPQVAPDLILADVHMPGLIGYQVCERVRQTPGFENTPVMLLVGSFEPFDESEARRVGANDFLTKPFQSIKQLVNKVRTLLESSNGSPELPETAQEENRNFEETKTRETPLTMQDQEDFNRDLRQTEDKDFSFENAAFDDELIQTTPGGSFAQTSEAEEVSLLDGLQEDEWQVVENNPSVVRREEESLYDAPIFESDADSLSQNFAANEQSEPDFGDALNIFESGQINESSDQMFDFEEPDTNSYSEPAEIDPAGTPDTRPTFASLFDDDDLLGIEDEVPAEIAENDSSANLTNTAQQPPPDAVTPEIVAPENENQSQELAPVNQQTGVEKSGDFAALNFPPEVIDAIAARVVERLSDKVIEKIAWEIVPDRFDLIVRKTIQNKDTDR